MNCIFLLLAWNFFTSASAAAVSPCITSMAPATVTENGKLQARKDKTVTLTVTDTVFSTLLTTVFISVVRTDTVIESIISISAGPTVTNTLTSIVSTTDSLTETSTSISSGPTVTSTAVSSTTETSSTTDTVLGSTVTATSKPDPVPQAEVEFQHTWVLVLIILARCLASILLAAWPITLIGMWLQRRRTTTIQSGPHQIDRNDGNNIPMNNLAARPPVSQNSTGRRNDALDDLDNIPLDDDLEANKPSKTKAAAAAVRAKLPDLTGFLINKMQSN